MNKVSCEEKKLAENANVDVYKDAWRHLRDEAFEEEEHHRAEEVLERYNNGE